MAFQESVNVVDYLRKFFPKASVLQVEYLHGRGGGQKITAGNRETLEIIEVCVAGEPSAPKTLFEAARDAQDGTRFKTRGGMTIKRNGVLFYANLGDRDLFVPYTALASTDFETIPPEPSKDDQPTKENRIALDGVHDKIYQLLCWPGARLGGTGWLRVGAHKFIKAEVDTRFDVVFETEEQARAAYSAECS